MRTHLCDVNVWLALTVEPHVHHGAAASWLAGIDEARSVVFCRVTQQSLLRLLTTSAVLAAYELAPLSNEAAWQTLDAYLRDDRIVLETDEPDGLGSVWRRLSERRTASPKLWADAYLAAWALTSGSRLVTTDGGFRAVPGLAVQVLT